MSSTPESPQVVESIHRAKRGECTMRPHESPGRIGRARAWDYASTKCLGEDTIGGRSSEMGLAKQLEPFVEDELLEGLEARVRDPGERLAHLRALCGWQASLEVEASSTVT